MLGVVGLPPVVGQRGAHDHALAQVAGLGLVLAVAAGMVVLALMHHVAPGEGLVADGALGRVLRRETRRVQEHALVHVELALNRLLAGAAQEMLRVKRQLAHPEELTVDALAAVRADHRDPPRVSYP
ncbi:hypothetical protein D3C72_1756570 [compost metagenome]